MTTTLESIKQLKAIALEEILNDDSLSRYKKLETIEENDLWKPMPWVQHPFKDSHFGEKFLEELKANPEENGYVCTIMDDIMSDGVENRGQTVYLSCYFEEDHPEYYDSPEEYEEFLNSEVTILTSRGRPSRSMKITKKEFMDHLWNWSIKNQCCSWNYDW
jgi:hypothetical protein